MFFQILRVWRLFLSAGLLWVRIGSFLLANRLHSDNLMEESRENLLFVSLRAVYPAEIAFYVVGIVWLLEGREYLSESG